MIPLEHIHPMLVHFPIVFIITLAGLDAIAALRNIPVTGRSGWGNASSALAVLAGVFAVATFAFGDVALEIAESGGFHSEIAEIHESLGTTTAIVLAVWGLVRAFLWLRNSPLPGWTRTAIPAIEVAAVAIVVATAYYGGLLVFSLGVNVSHM